MTIYLYHRYPKAFNNDLRLSDSTVTKIKETLSETDDENKIVVLNVLAPGTTTIWNPINIVPAIQEDNLHIDIEANRWSSTSYTKDTFSIDIPIKDGGLYMLFYHRIQNAGLVVDRKIISPYRNNQETQNVIYIGSVFFDGDDVLLYFRGNYSDIDGVENIDISDYSNSLSAFAKNNENANKVITKLSNKQSFLSDVDPLDSICYLEAQVDLLTKIILNSNLTISDDDREILQAADTFGIYRNNTKEQLLQKMEDKNKFRTKQLEYYETKE